VPEQRQSAGRLAELGGGELGQAFFDGEPASPGRLLHRPYQVRFRERAEEHLAGRQPVGELREGAELAVEVGPHRDDQPAGMGDHGVDEGRPFDWVVAHRDQLLELIDDEDRRVVTGDAGPLECLLGVGPWSHDDHFG
jgi:hypothetical protein